MTVTTTLSEQDRAAILDREVEKYVRKGYRVTSRTPTTAQLVKPKVFSRLWAFLWFLVFGVGLIVYLLWYAAKRDKTVYLTADEQGRVHRR